MKTVLRTLAALAILGALAGGSVVLFGLYNVSARLGHLPFVTPILHTTFRNSVETWSMGTDVPEDLGTADRVDLGAGHFDTACRTCHAAPGDIRSATVLSMVPQPPHIREAVGHWDAGELHWIVYQGVKMSGMPAWPADRPDEVWSVVAFLQQVEDMDETRYRALNEVEVPADAPPKTAYCASCHEADGVSGNALIPRLDILSETYIDAALDAYRGGDRESGFMRQAATSIGESDLAALASYFASRGPGAAAETTAAPEQVERGRAIAYAEVPGSEDVPACRACHGPWPEPIDQAFPSLAGQYAPYLETQLDLWREGERGGGPRAELMHEAAERLTDEQIADVAAYYASLAPATLDEVAE
ncbi:c-type cytochrome [Palleronia sp. LCG004]|uniref:c-type cytochrome n=1 Tax=Palleronia sp. LCG004 TaxID=3079304 RepID=UPI002941EEC8|nr:c-type cytochrome [Palleronia sp. LCG004]WOI55268.1 c-type cytochrome [Palleronia sp. LCG004]